MRTKLEQNVTDNNPFLSESHSKLSTSKLGWDHHEGSRPGVLPGLVQKAGGLLGSREARAVCSAETGTLWIMGGTTFQEQPGRRKRKVRCRRS